MKKIDYYITIRNYINKGQGELNFIKNTIVIIAGFELVFKNLEFSIFSGIMYLITGYVIGHYWDFKRFFDRETEWSNRRNPMLKKINKNMKKKGQSDSDLFFLSLIISTMAIIISILNMLLNWR